MLYHTVGAIPMSANALASWHILSYSQSLCKTLLALQFHLWYFWQRRPSWPLGEAQNKGNILRHKRRDSNFSLWNTPDPAASYSLPSAARDSLLRLRFRAKMSQDWDANLHRSDCLKDRWCQHDWYVEMITVMVLLFKASEHTWAAVLLLWGYNLSMFG